MKVFQVLQPEQRFNLLVLFAAGLLFWAALASLLPTLPLYLDEAGANSQQIGIVMGSFAIGLLLFRSVLAQLADNRGRKLVLLIGMIAVAVAPLGYLMTDEIPLLIGIRAFHGLSIAAFAMAYTALVVDLSPPNQRGELIGYMSLVNPTGMALGPAIGGYLQQWMGFVPAFVVAAALGFLGLCCTFQVREPKVHATVSNSTSTSNQFWRLLGTPRIRIPAVVLFLIGLAFGALTTFLPLFVKETGVDLNVGLFYSAAAIASFGIRLITGRASDRFGRGPFITFSLVLYASSMVTLWNATSATAFLVAGVLEGSGAGILIPMMAALMADRSQPNERGRIFSLCMVGFDLGIAVAGPLLGAIAAFMNYRFIFGIAALLTVLSLVVFLMLSSKNIECSLRFATGRGKDIYAIES